MAIHEVWEELHGGQGGILTLSVWEELQGGQGGILTLSVWEELQGGQGGILTLSVGKSCSEDMEGYKLVWRIQNDLLRI